MPRPLQTGHMSRRLSSCPLLLLIMTAEQLDHLCTGHDLVLVAHYDGGAEGLSVQVGGPQDVPGGGVVWVRFRVRVRVTVTVTVTVRVRVLLLT